MERLLCSPPSYWGLCLGSFGSAEWRYLKRCFYSLSHLRFSFLYRWLQNKQNKYLVLAGLTVGLGFLTKYQAVVAGIVMLVSIMFLARGQLKWAYLRFTLAVVAAVLVVIPWIVVAYRFTLSRFSVNGSTPCRWEPRKISIQRPLPLTDILLNRDSLAYSNFHPISIFLYVAGLAGLVFLLWRHSKGDKFILIWFASIFIFFTFIENKEWRYVLPLFPALAIAAAVFILFLYGKVGGRMEKAAHSKQEAKRARLALALLVALAAGAMAYSVYDAYSMASAFDIQIQLEPATLYALNHMQNNQSIMVLCTIQPLQPRHDKILPRQKRQHPNPNLPIPHSCPLTPTRPPSTSPNSSVNANKTTSKYLFTYE